MCCQVCRKGFDIKENYYKNGGGWTCSNKCRAVWHSKKMKGRKSWICGKTKEQYPQLSNSGAKKGFIPWHKGKTKKDFPQLSNSGVKKGNVPWNKGLRGVIKSWNKGKKLSPSHIENLRKSHIGQRGYWMGKERLDMKGDGHWNWAGGKSFEPYTSEFTTYKKEQIRKRDGWICQLCGKTQLKEYWGGKKTKLAIHHIDYRKANCDEKNLITLCRLCNNKVNRDRVYWTKYFQNKIN